MSYDSSVIPGVNRDGRTPRKTYTSHSTVAVSSTTETQSQWSGWETPSPVSSSNETPASPSATHISPWKKSNITYDLTGSTACTTPDVALARRLSPGEYLPNYNQISASKAIIPAADGTTFAYKYPSSVPQVVEINSRDNADLLVPWKRRINQLTPFTTIISMSSYIAYLITRLTFTIEVSQKAGSSKFGMAWSFMAVEFIIQAPILVHQMFQVIAWRGRKRPMQRLIGDFAPTVDVVITCCGEEVDMILDTARACCNLDYPADRYRIIIADDGANPDVEAGVQALKSSHLNVYYHARVKQKGIPHHAKAGNLVGATAFADKLEGGSAEFLACLDADMIPVKYWLRAIMAGHVKDSELGLVCPPQLFYNVPKDDPLTQRLDGFAHVMEPVKDSVGVAWCTGSGYAIRRTALDSIGGWPVGTLAEDTLTSSLLLGKGWKTAYVHEALQCGTVPEDYSGHLKQRTRWTLGTLQMSQKLNFFVGGEIVRHMSAFQRLSGLVIAFDAMWKPFIVAAQLMVPIALSTGKPMVAFRDPQQLITSLVLNALAVNLNNINDYVVGLPAGYRQTQRDTVASMWMSPYHARTVIQSFILPKWLGGRVMAFQPTGSLGSRLHERDPARRAPLAKRLKFIVWDCNAWVHLLYICFCSTAIGLSIWHSYQQRHDGSKAVFLYLVTHLLWPPFLSLRLMYTGLTPIFYAIFPPDMPTDREQYFDRDQKTGVPTPKMEFRQQRWSWWNKMYEFLTFSTGAYCFVAIGLVVGWVSR